MDQLANEMTALQQECEALEAQKALREAREQSYRDTVTLLTAWQGEMPAIEASKDVVKQRQIIQLLVDHVRIDTKGAGRRKTFGFEIGYRFTAIQ